MEELKEIKQPDNREPVIGINSNVNNEDSLEGKYKRPSSSHSDTPSKQDKTNLLNVNQSSLQRSASSPPKSTSIQEELEESKGIGLEKRIFKPKTIPKHILVDSDELPKTGLFLPFELPFKNPSKMMDKLSLEELGPVTSSATIQELQKQGAERLASIEENNKLVYDFYEPSPYQEDYDYDEFKFYSSECYNIEASSVLYPQICSGKGAPMRYYPGISRYSTIQLKPFYKLQSPEDTTLIFESRFESGNLRRAVQV